MEHIYSDPTFQMACDQFQLIADYLQIPNDLRSRLLYPKRSIVVAVPVRMDDGSTQLFQGYRVQHTLAIGPTKGGTALQPHRDYWRGDRSGHVDELEMCPHGIALRRRKRGRVRRSAKR